ncbi:protoheme IX farnesyltransferase mitochondrial precursor [Lindgomyces ingoldianus]|uniref:Protoheme IX farnesyltransferase mitochondrial n=1 Tax=Lindgomyces ingoldianus TaxID=673940 RepID=A0ACB6RBH3_9PLEO|nr:protoheme IX farnesyltransferase mitochondrial precursor [Lindgomyces ingoldianus]KAF2476501.1 protoheme IX farnesyltransferase mitochondrial precursor [Lindgomyces ingoldianus]
MTLRPPIPRAISIQDTNTLCLRCWRRLSRTSPPPRHSFTTVPSARHGAVAVGKSRNSFSKDYFWANPTLKESLGNSLARSKRELQSSVASAKAGASADATSDEILPHRRKKKKTQEQAAGSAETDFPIPPDASSKLTTLSSNLPTQSIRRLLATYLSLAKPRLSFLVVLTATAAYSLYPVPGLLAPAATATPSLSTLTLLFLTTGTALCSSSANAFNMLLEPTHDAKMSRTRNRPLVRKLISPKGALIFAIGCGVAGTGALFYGVNPTTAFLGAANILLYAGIYTPMKRMSVINTWVGAIVGGIPPLMGWTAAAGQCAHEGTWQELLFGESSAGGWLCAALLFAWQFPHFNSLSWAIRDEYKHAGYRMLCWVNTAQNGRVALRYALLMFPVCFGLSFFGVTDWGFVATSSAANGWMAWKAYEFWREKGHKGTARGLFWASVWHLPIVMVLAMAQKKGLMERVWRSIVGYPEEDDLYYDVEEELGSEKETPDALVGERGVS